MTTWAQVSSLFLTSSPCSLWPFFSPAPAFLQYCTLDNGHRAVCLPMNSWGRSPNPDYRVLILMNSLRVAKITYGVHTSRILLLRGTFSIRVERMLKKITVAEGMNYRATLDQDFGAVPLEV